MELIGTPIKSKFTGVNGTVTGIDKKNLFVTFTYGGNISVPLQKYEELFIMSDEAKELVREYIDSLKKARKKKEPELE